MNYYENLFRIVVSVELWFFFIIWSGKDIFNFSVKFFCLVMALLSTFFLLNDFGFIIKV